MSLQPEIIHNEASHRFEASLDGRLAVAEYRINGERILFTHTEVPPEFRGKGIAEKLVLAGFAFARQNNLKIVPVCSYVVRVLERHPDYQS